MPTISTLLGLVAEDLKYVEDKMRAGIASRYQDLQAVIDYLVGAGGKRLRPALTLMAANFYPVDKDKSYSLAASVELLHTATLVHDDLIDGSLLRRGMPTLNSQWTPGATVLTGDFLFACAAKLASDTDSIPVMSLFSQTLKVIVNGEIIQLFNGRCKVDRDEYYQRIYAKTASLFETSAKSAALLCECDDKTTEAMRQFGYNIGMAFQIVDDVLDFTGEQQTLGKPVGSDLRQGLITLPTIYYLENHPEDRLVNELASGDCSKIDNRISQLVDAIRSSSAVSLAIQEACEFVDRGLATLFTFPPGPERDSLQELATFFLNREL